MAWGIHPDIQEANNRLLKASFLLLSIHESTFNSYRPSPFVWRRWILLRWTGLWRERHWVGFVNLPYHLFGRRVSGEKIRECPCHIVSIATKAELLNSDLSRRSFSGDGSNRKYYFSQL
jgi:hypothetical protein